MSAYTGLTAPQLLALLADKRKEEDAILAALTAAVGGVRLSAPAKGGAGGAKVAKGAKAASSADSSSTSSGRSRTAWNAWVAQLNTLYPGQVQPYVKAKMGSPIEFASAKKTEDAERYARFVAAWKAAGMSADADSQAARAVIVDDDGEDDDASSVGTLEADSDDEGASSDEEEAPAPAAALVRRKAGLGGGGSKVGAPAAAAPSAAGGAGAGAGAPVPKPKAAAAAPAPAPAAEAPKPKRKAPSVPAVPKPVSLWTTPDGSAQYYRNEDCQLWEVEPAADGSPTLGDWAGVLDPATGDIDSTAKEPAMKPFTA
jgi:DNA polymerase-3 subunit gamma/tau